MKISKKQLAVLLDEWAERARLIAELEQQQEADLAPERKRWQKAATTIEEKYASQLTTLKNEATELHAEISKSLQAGVNEQTGSITLAQVGTELAEAQVSAKPVRKIDALGFFNTVAERSERFWQCVEIGIQKAEGWLGKDRVRDLATTSYKPVVTLRRKKN